MLKAKTVIEKLFKAEVLQLVLVLHLHLNDLRLLDELIPYEILRQVDMRDAGVMLQKLCQNEEVLRVKILIS
jgi:hypothetical protein